MQASQIAQVYAHAAAEVAAEIFWPTRCVLCGTLGEVLCKTCYAKLPFIDHTRACPVCGGPYGQHQCCCCNSFSLANLGYKTLPYTACVSAVHFDEHSARIVRMRKDQGERRLAQPMAFAIACALPPEWLDQPCTVTHIPGSGKTLRRRGFDHGAELAQHTSQLLHLPARPLLSIEHVADQRGLGRTLRAQNVRGRFSAACEPMPRRVIVIDDVYTTGSTVMAASETLRSAGVKEVYVATFART